MLEVDVEVTKGYVVVLGAVVMVPETIIVIMRW